MRLLSSGFLRRAAGGAVLGGGLFACSAHTSNVLAEPRAGDLVLSGDCGGTNTRLVLFRVPPGAKAERGKVPDGEVVLAKHYRNAENTSFTSCMQQFLADTDKLTGALSSAQHTHSGGAHWRTFFHLW